MRHLLTAAALVVAVRAHADKPARVDTSGFADKAEVWRDAAGKLYVLPKYGAPSDDAHAVTFYGDGRTMHRQQIVSFSTASGVTSMMAWAPRARGLSNGLIEIRSDGTAHLICRIADRRYERLALTRVAADDAARLYARATFLPPLWDRRVWFFGRGTSTTYYLVDALASGEGYRLFVGTKGRMKQVAITDFSSDTAGAVVVTKRGALQIAPDRKTAAWKHGKKTIAIVPLDKDANKYLIYRELAVYGQLGTICEDQ